MKEIVTRLVALSALAAAADMLAPEGAARRSLRFIAGLLTACALAELAAGLPALAGL